MLLSEMFGVERDTGFGVKGYESLFKVTLNAWGEEHLMFKFPCVSAWEPVPQGMLCSVIFAAPSGIIPLPPPLTDEQREQLRAIWTLGGRWLAKGKDDRMFAYDVHPVRSDSGYWWNCSEIFRVSSQLEICGLVSPNSTIPYDIAKALGVTK